ALLAAILSAPALPALDLPEPWRVTQVRVAPRPMLHVERAPDRGRGAPAALVAHVRFRYEEAGSGSAAGASAGASASASASASVVTDVSTPALVVADPPSGRLFRRDPAAERAALDQVAHHGFRLPSDPWLRSRVPHAYTIAATRLAAAVRALVGLG